MGEGATDDASVRGMTTADVDAVLRWAVQHGAVMWCDVLCCAVLRYCVHDNMFVV